MRPDPLRSSPRLQLALPLAFALLVALHPGVAGAVHVGLSAQGGQLFANGGVFPFLPVPGDLFAYAVAAGDFNGDGIDDLATGIPQQDGRTGNPKVDIGAVVVRYGVAGAGLESGLSDTILTEDVALSPDLALPGDRYGKVLAVGDFNGDGVDDLAVGVPNNATGGVNAGAVFIHYGDASGIQSIAEHLLHQGTAGMPLVWGDSGFVGGDLFGAALAAGNFDGDLSKSGHGYDDLAIGAPGDQQCCCASDCGSHSGSVVVLHGGAGGLLPIDGYVISQGAEQPQIPDTEENGDDFGFALAAGNFNGDQDEFGNRYDDLAIGVPGEDGQGAVLAVFGSNAGLLFANNVWWGQGDVGGVGELDDRFAHALAAGDFDGDGNDDLAIGDPYEDLTGANAGDVTILQGTTLTEVVPIPQLFYARKWFDRNRTDHWNQGNIFGSTAYDQTNDLFGFALATGDFDADGFDDLAIGQPGEDVGGVDRGGVTVLTGAATTGLVRYFRFLSAGNAALPGSAQNSQDFGRALASGDFDGDGFADLAIGVPYRDENGIGADLGQEIVLYGSLYADGFDAGSTFEWSSVEP